MALSESKANMNKARDRMASAEIEWFSDVEWQLTACLRIITYEKGSCSKMEKLIVTLTANNIAKGDYVTFFCLLSGFCTLKRKKFTHKPWTRSVFFSYFNFGGLQQIWYLRCFNRPHTLLQPAIQNVNIAERQKDERVKKNTYRFRWTVSLNFF